MTSNDQKNVVITIQKELLGKKLSYREIYNLMDQIAHKKLSDILTTYFVAASFKRGYGHEELYHFTKAMVETGNRLHFKGIVADKHSIGGVAGTRATMILVPIVAAAGFKIPKISSRAITTPAGTADAMEVFAGVEFTLEQLEHIVNTVGGCICWNGKLGIAPADDVLIQIEEPLAFESFDKIIVSVMAKKIAASTTHLVLDIPIGKSMKIVHEKDAQRVARTFEMLGKKFGMEVVATVNKTREPAGFGIGPALEARDVLKVLEQTEDRPKDLENRALYLAGTLLDMCYKESKIKKHGFEEAQALLKSGAALKKFKDIIQAQGGSPHVTSRTMKLLNKKHVLYSDRAGYVKDINNHNLNSIAKMLGAPHDKYAGIVLLKKIGDTITFHEPIMELYTKDSYLLKEAESSLKMFPIHVLDVHL
jgi:putative thymidine phosphorylase